MGESVKTGGLGSLDTPALIAFVGLGLGLVEGVYDLLNPGLYTGEFNGVVVTETDIIITTAVAMVLLLVAMVYLYSQRSEITRKTYLVVAVLSVLGLLIGVLFSTVIAIGATMVGYWSLRKAPTETPVT